MRAILRIAGQILAAERWALARGIALAVIVLAFGVALLGLSGWFITAAGMAGLAGLGIAFDVFRPSAGVRFLALGRTAARYGERLLTHDATLRSLAALRVRLLKSLSRRAPAQLTRLRASEQLNRITLDVDALDGIALRLLIPLAAGAVTLAATFTALWLLVDPLVVIWLAASFVAGVAAALALVFARSRSPSRRARLALNALRMRMVDMLRARTALTMAGQLDAHQAVVFSADRRLRRAEAAVDRAERTGGFLLSAAETVAAAGVLAIGGVLVRDGTIGAAPTALGFLATLALAEVAVPLRRGLSEYGRMADAAGRVCAMLDDGAATGPAPGAGFQPVRTVGGVLSFKGVGYRYPHAKAAILKDFSLALRAGETVALTGPSGSGKSTLLHLAAGLLGGYRGSVSIDGRPVPEYQEPDLRRVLALLPQCSMLMSGTIREALTMAEPGLGDAEAWAALEAVALDTVVVARGGLDSRLGEAGTGLSGGESRRLALARVLVRKPRIVLLDEPTEGLDRETAETVLAGMRAYLPDATFLMASHRAAERAFAGRIVAVQD